MRHLVTLVATSLPSEETVLAHVKVEALQTPISRVMINVFIQQMIVAG